MQSFRYCLAATAISMALVTCPRASASPEFSDGTFNAADWNLVTTWFGGPGTVGAAQATAGGNPGAYRKITNVAGSGPSNLQVVLGAHLLNTANYAPATSGGFESVSLSLDSIFLSGLPSRLGIAVEQDGVIYYSGGSVGQFDNGRESTWTNHQLPNLAAGDFYDASHWYNFDPSGPHPDFSGSGSPVTFGFYSEAQVLGLQAQAPAVGGVDNYDLTITLPEPSSVLCCFVALMLVHRRGSRW